MSGPAESAAKRALGNTAVRAAAEITGKLATLALYAGIARATGASGLGVFVLAASFAELGLVIVDLGLDRYMTREVARDPERRLRLFSDVLALKLTLLVPVAAGMMLLSIVLDYDGQTRAAVALLIAGFAIDSLARTVFGLFTAYERGRPVATVVLVQRTVTAALGLTALAVGFGIVTVAGAYVAGAATGLLCGALLLRRSIGMPPWSPDPARWARLASRSLPFALEGVFMLVLFRLDAVILGQLSTDVEVGRYGAAYRMFEATLFIPFAMVAAFAAMYAYLGSTTTPTLAYVFERSIKFAIACLLPVGIIFGVFAEPLLTTIFGDELAAAAEPLRLLAPAVPLIGVVTLCIALVVSRGRSQGIIALTAVIAALNVGLNLALIPANGANGAALAMLVSEGLFAAAALVISARRIGGMALGATFGAPLLAGAAMLSVVLALGSPALVTAPIGLLVYGAVLLATERVASPEDFDFAARLARDQLASIPSIRREASGP